MLAGWELLFVSAVMQAGLALPMAYYFHRATTIGLPANLIVIPPDPIDGAYRYSCSFDRVHISMAG